MVWRGRAWQDRCGCLGSGKVGRGEVCCVLAVGEWFVQDWLGGVRQVRVRRGRLWQSRRDCIIKEVMKDGSL